MLRKLGNEVKFRSQILTDRNIIRKSDTGGDYEF